MFTPVWAQITDASIFPSVKSINPGVVHMRRGGLASVNYGKKSSEKIHHVKIGGITEPIETNIDLTKTTFFGAAASRMVSAELLFDKETGQREESIKHPTRGNRTSTDDAESTYYGGVLDFRFFGVSFAKANYNYLNEFRVGTPPDLTARDEEKDLDYTNFKVGSAIKIGALRVGAFFMNQKAEGDYIFTFYDPTSGAKGTTEAFPVKHSIKGFGVGVGVTFPKFRSEVSLERMYDSDFDLDEDYPREVTEPKDSSRITALAEANLRYFSVGVRFRSIKGNFIDLEDIISTNLLYDSLGENASRTEATFNFSLGDTKGFSPSAFYTRSEVTSKERSPVFDDGTKFKAVTKSSAYGVALSYRF
jgi:hypothetical protein